jgi:all-trans-retinol 13,14-reductase
MNHNLYYYRTPTVWNCEHYDAQSWPKFLLYMHFCHEENPTYAETGEVLTYMGVDEVNQWLGTRVGRRGDDYEDFKRRKAERLLDALEEEVPGIRDHIETYYTSTPLTYLDYTGVPDGAMYGIAKDVNLVGMGSVSCRTSIPNLLLAGQCVTLHGMMGVLAGSLLTCAEVLTLDEVFAQLKCDE